MDTRLLLTTGKQYTALQAGLWVPGLRRHMLHKSIRGYATPNTLGGIPKTSRKQITVANDDGGVNWKELSVGEKAARTTQQTFNFGIILMGLVMTGG
ncbi:MAG: hypothetical protein Q9198_011260, partial [Flavoplaca austrocitrina]